MEHVKLSEGAFMWLDASFIEPAHAQSCFSALRDELPWEQRSLRMFGREIPEPRLVAWLGDPGARYTYSGRLNEPSPWTPTTAALRDAVCARLEQGFNGVLANLYRSERDGMGYHADEEPELGPSPLVASLSFGAPRRFVVRARRGGARHALWLGPGSLLVMAGTMQHEFVHALPKQRAPVGPRINLTFRRITRAEE
jgi:alkylated DNA repair dioxygenase AlkB